MEQGGLEIGDKCLGVCSEDAVEELDGETMVGWEVREVGEEACAVSVHGGGLGWDAGLSGCVGRSMRQGACGAMSNGFLWG